MTDKQEQDTAPQTQMMGLVVSGQEFANQVRSITHKLHGQAYSSTVSALNKFDADLRRVRASITSGGLTMTYNFSPCPFCGGSASIERLTDGSVELGCDNINCGVRPSTKRLSVKEAAEKWNPRVTARHQSEKALRSSIDRLRAYATGSNDVKFDTYDAADVIAYIERLSPPPQSKTVE